MTCRSDDPCTRIRDELRAAGYDCTGVCPDEDFPDEWYNGHFPRFAGLLFRDDSGYDGYLSVAARCKAPRIPQPDHGFAVGDRVAYKETTDFGTVEELTTWAFGEPAVRVVWDFGERSRHSPEHLVKLPHQPEHEATVEEPTQPEDKAEHCAGCKAPLRPNQVGFACIGSPIVLCFYCYARTERQDLPAGSYEAESGPGLRAVPVVDPDPITGPCFATAGWEEP